MKMDDLVLVQCYRDSGDSDYVGELFERYHHLVFGVCLKYLNNREEAKDAALQVFEKLMSDLHKHEVHNFSSWLHSVTRNHCLMILRKKSRHYQHELGYNTEMHIVPKDDDLEAIKIKEVQLNLLEEAIQNLNEEQRQCIELFFLNEKCYKEIEDITGYTNKQVKSYIQNGKRNLKLTIIQRNELAV
ncbi:MAG: sigma-70 family RNA polymerase sigma factor [Bacteroidales bacterium]|nr:sigma-70 family RNA polymerase sigma factor [Bacteroidales bacterium]MCF8458088.1 sigma-70 family RNA polymerase sigma factor [Bacteroidales bacterium]